MTRADVAVVGLGPAGRALVHRLLARGARVLAIDPAPDQVWEPTYGGWAEHLPSWLPSHVIGSRSTHTLLVARADHVLPGQYAVLCNEALHAALRIDGAEVVAGTVTDDEMPALAPVVVDCRGAHRDLARHPRPLQTAYGVRLPREVAHPLLGGADAVLMDWRPYDGGRRWGSVPPSFCYVVPLPDGRVLAEETHLAGDPALDVAELGERLTTRLAVQGVDVRPWTRGGTSGAGRDIEIVRIPMLPPPVTVAGREGPPSRGAPLRFGSLGDQLNPMTGYSVFASLAGADAAALALMTTGALPRHRAPRIPALRALLGLPPDDLIELFDAFGRLPHRDQQAVFDPHTPAHQMVTALYRQWTRMPPRSRVALIAATARGVR